MREIRFRAWDKKYNLMERGLFGLRSDGLVSSNSGPDNVVLMQFTGLKDKNGKSIYEGDILSHKGIGIWEVVFVKGSFCLSCIKGKNIGYPDTLRHFCDYQDGSFEVIGNKYETELRGDR